MKKTIFLFIIYLVFFTNASHASENEYCSKLKNKKTPEAYLIDPSNKISKGPIDLGTIPIPSGFVQENKMFKSGYKIVVVPTNLEKHEEIQMGLTTVLTRINPICKNTLTFRVDLVADFKGNQIRPYKFSTELTWFTKPEDDYGNHANIPELYRHFDPRVIGIFVEP